MANAYDSGLAVARRGQKDCISAPVKPHHTLLLKYLTKALAVLCTRVEDPSLCASGGFISPAC
jgi:hypothetical protein